MKSARANKDPAREFSPVLLRQPLLLAFGMVATLLLLTLGPFTPRYETLDDPIMNLIVAGRAFGDVPDEHIVFSNVLISVSPCARPTSRHLPFPGMASIC